MFRSPKSNCFHLEKQAWTIKSRAQQGYQATFKFPYKETTFSIVDGLVPPLTKVKKTVASWSQE